MHQLSPDWTNDVIKLMHEILSASHRLLQHKAFVCDTSSYYSEPPPPSFSARLELQFPKTTLAFVSLIMPRTR